MNFLRSTMTGVSLLVLAVLFIALVILGNATLSRARIDLTQNRLYTLSQGTKNILANIDEPVNLYFFFSDQAARDVPALRNYSTRVKEILSEFVQLANGKLKLHVIDPQPFSEDEDRASQYGLQSIPVGNSSDNVYFGLAGTNSTDGVQTISFFQPDKEPFLEYDLAKLVYTLAKPKKPVIALYSTLPMAGGFDPMTQQPQQPWIINEQIRQLFDLRVLGGDVKSIDKDVDVLMLVHPKGLSEQTLYAIDQFILRGGRAMIFVDPHADVAAPPPNPQNPGEMFQPRDSNLAKLFDAWGIKVDTNQIIGDSYYALSISYRQDQPPVRHLGIFNLDKASLAQDDVITSGLSNLTMDLAGSIQRLDNAKVTMTPLIRSSVAAMPIATEKVRFLPDPKDLQKGFAPTGQSYVLAARVSGKVPSAFPDGAPKPKEGDKKDEASADKDKKDEPKKDDAPPLKESTGPINVIVVADVDILSDRLWVRSQNFFGQRVASAFANNADFVVNALDNLVGNSDLLGMRGRAISYRPFTKVQELERDADQKFRAKEQELMAELQDTEKKLSELQSARQDKTAAGNTLILTPEQRAEVERFQSRKVEIRKELRQVRHDLDKDIQKLGNWMKVINIGLMPIVVSIIALLSWIGLRSWRRRTQ
ncbi:MAG: Gldg family protein [Gammaproteobacteria bacterium]